MKPRFIVAIVVGALVLGGAGLVFAQSRETRHNLEVFAVAPFLNGKGTVIIGDSRVSNLRTETLCGESLTHVGVSGVGLDGIRSLVETLAAISRPRRFLISIGVNDALAKRDFDPVRWEAVLDDDTKMLAKTGAAVGVLSVVPNAADGDYGAGYIDLDRVAVLNKIVDRKSAIPVNGALTDPATGRLRSDLTKDGVHYNDAGEAALLQATAAAICPPPK